MVANKKGSFCGPEAVRMETVKKLGTFADDVYPRKAHRMWSPGIMGVMVGGGQLVRLIVQYHFIFHISCYISPAALMQNIFAWNLVSKHENHTFPK